MAGAPGERARRSRTRPVYLYAPLSRGASPEPGDQPGWEARTRRFDGRLTLGQVPRQVPPKPDRSGRRLRAGRIRPPDPTADSTRRPAAPLSRRCRAARGCRAGRTRRAATRAAAGRPRRSGSPCPSPSSSLSRWVTIGASNRNWVAHAVESARAVSRPSTKRSGRQCAATSPPTMVAHRPNTPCTASSVLQPCSATSRDIARPTAWGSRSSGPAPEAWESWAARRGSDRCGGDPAAGR